MNTQAQTTTHDPAALYAKWTAAAKDTRWRYRDATAGEFYPAMDRAAAWSDGAAQVYTAEDIAAYLAEQIARGADIKTETRATYADMLNDVHASTGDVAELRATVARLEAEVAELSARLDTETV